MKRAMLKSLTHKRMIIGETQVREFNKKIIKNEQFHLIKLIQ